MGSDQTAVGGTGWKNKKAQAREHLGQSRLRLENCYLREVSSRDANRPRLVIIRRDSVCLIAMEDFMTRRNMPYQRPWFKPISTRHPFTEMRNAIT
jgi:hypothetical protein